MLKDVVRTKTYQNVGVGTGILSLFWAKAGAKHVYVIECSQMADIAQEIVKAYCFSNVITVLKGKVEEIDLPVPQVDIIISEWMGYFLLYENIQFCMLVINGWHFVSNGIVLPDIASLHLTAIEDSEYKEDKIESELVTNTIIFAGNSKLQQLLHFFRLGEGKMNTPMVDIDGVREE
ncbi:hypothetical protein L1987_36050 [Smallanthus sonchifolius]|uniref:Uncharacterized protein n=1 Tax=Smallanthus sonchifolius TaxID=185202 RepID=A0ACB9HD47_9ASTR|nr:hypothetical protein L1987_36050 [Smallanthus sonchifolius]